MKTTITNDATTLTFNDSVSSELGLYKAILIDDISFGIKLNRDNDNQDVFHNNTFWMYKSAKRFQEKFPFMRESVISRHLRELEADGIIISRYDKSSSRTNVKYYTFIDEDLCRLYNIDKPTLEEPHTQHDKDTSAVSDDTLEEKKTRSMSQQETSSESPHTVPSYISTKSNKIECDEHFEDYITHEYFSDVLNADCESYGVDINVSVDEVYDAIFELKNNERLDVVNKYDVTKAIRHIVESKFVEHNN